MKQYRNERQFTLHKVLKDKTLLETVVDPTDNEPYFLIQHNGKITQATMYVDPSTGEAFQSPSMSDLNNLHIFLPEVPRNENIMDDLFEDNLLNEISDLIQKYADLTSQQVYLCALYAINTWVYDIYDKVPYLRFLGIPESGKSRIMHIMEHLCRNPLYLNGAISEASIFRLINKGEVDTMILDEMNFQFSSRNSGLTKILNGGYEKGSYVVRCDPLRYEPQLYSFYGPKIIANNSRFEDPALESRMLTIEMSPTSRHDITDQLSDDWFEPIATSIRNSLLAFRLENFSRIDTRRKYPELDQFSNRVRELSLPLLRTMSFEEVPTEMMEYLLAYQSSLNETKMNSPEALVPLKLCEMKKRGLKKTYPGKISSELWSEGFFISAQTVSQIVSNHGVRKLSRDCTGQPIDLTSFTEEELKRRCGLVG